MTFIAALLVGSLVLVGLFSVHRLYELASRHLRTRTWLRYIADTVPSHATIPVKRWRRRKAPPLVTSDAPGIPEAA
jgi:hypothetical protein